MRILVVDNDSITLELMAVPLEALGYAVRTAGSGEEAWQRICAGETDLVISDWGMPGLSGLELCQRIRERDRGLDRYTYFILVSSRDDVHDVVEALQSGADEFLAKPISPFELKAHVESITRLRDLHQALRQRNDELLRMQDMRNDWVHMIVHDLRSPLAVVQGSCEMMEMFPDRDHGKRIQTAIRECHRVQNLLEEMLITAKSEAGTLRAHLESTEIGRFVEDAVAANKGLATNREVTIRYRQGVSGNADLDRSLMRRAIDNLISNAIKYGGHGSHVEVAVHDIGPNVRLSVRDEGPGITLTNQARLFERYSTFETSERVSQTGLGLSFCRMVARAHGGRIEYHDAKPQGSVFSLTWPRESSERKDPRVSAPERATNRSAIGGVSL